MWAEALDRDAGASPHSGLDLRRLAAISGSAQQHGSVYLNDERRPRARRRSIRRGRLPPQVVPLLSRPVAPIWMDSSTRAECAEIAAAVGGAGGARQHTGSRAFERFTGPQIRKFATQRARGATRPPIASTS